MTFNFYTMLRQLFVLKWFLNCQTCVKCGKVGIHFIYTHF